MPKDNNSSKYKKHDKKRRVRKNGGRSDDDNSDSSIDARGNIRNLISYDSSSEDDRESYYHSRTPSPPPERRHPSKRPVRKAAKDARNKIHSILTSEPNKNKKIQNKTDKKKNTIHYPKVTRKTNTPVRSMKRPSKASPTASRRPNHKQSTTKEYDLPSSDESNSDMDMYDREEDDEDEETTDEGSFIEESDEEESNQEDMYDDDDEEEEEEEEEGEVEEEYEDDDEEENGNAFGKILLALAGSKDNGLVPKKHQMNKESELVKKFVKLITTPVEENTIDTQIDQFKALPNEKQYELIDALEKRTSSSDNGIDLMLKIMMLQLPQEIKSMILCKYNSLQSLDTSSNEYFKLRAWLDKVVSVPFGTYKDVPVRLDDGSDKCSDYMKYAKKCLDDAVFGQEDSKLQILQFISTKIANPNGRGLSLLFIGPPGVGKTSIIKNGISKALGWPFQFISLGGDSDASTYTGHQLVYESSHCGKIVNSLVASKSMSTVMMFDEVDKISQTPKGEEVMNLLIHLTDPVQNGDFEDKYLSGIPIDLSKVMFVFSANDINKIDKILLDRMIVINLNGYDLKQKTVIAEQYLLPEALKDVNLTEKVAISKEILTMIVQEYSGDEKGVRELKRCIDQVVQKINMLRIYNSPDLPFYIKDFALPFIVKKDHIKLFLKKKENHDAPPHGMYL